MIKTMVFIDFMNFQIELNSLYSNSAPSLDYIRFPQELVSYVPNACLMKTYFFHPKPDNFLMADAKLNNTYNWVNGVLRKFDNFEIIEGEYIARPTSKSSVMDINDHTTYYKVEKGTDINIATQMLTKAFNNAYDVAILLSGDSDYVPVLKQLNNLGKTVIVCGIKGQNIDKLKVYADKSIYLEKAFFDKCKR